MESLVSLVKDLEHLFEGRQPRLEEALETLFRIVPVGGILEVKPTARDELLLTLSTTGEVAFRPSSAIAKLRYMLARVAVLASQGFLPHFYGIPLEEHSRIFDDNRLFEVSTKNTSGTQWLRIERLA